jgi:integrase
MNDLVSTTVSFSKEKRNMSKKKLPPGIIQRGNRWRIDTFYKGVRIRETCATPEMAETNLRKIQTLIDEGRYLEKKKVSKETLEEVSKRYLKWCEDVRQKDLRSKKQRIEVIKDKLGKDTSLSKITRADIERFQAERLSSLSGKSDCPIKPATVNREMALLKHVLTKAVEWSIIEHNPAKGIKLSKENNRRLRYLTPDECELLLNSCPVTKLRRKDTPLPILRWIVDLALNTGMRKGEVLHLKRESVHLREGFIELIEQKNGERSTIPLNAAAISILKSIPVRIDSPYVFPGKIQGKPFTDLKRQFDKAVKKSGLEEVTFHTLRHTTASLLVMQGVDLTTVRDILRRKSIEMTLRYAHLAPAHRKAAVDALEEALKPKEAKKAKEPKTA